MLTNLEQIADDNCKVLNCMADETVNKGLITGVRKGFIQSVPLINLFSLQLFISPQFLGIHGVVAIPLFRH